MLLRCKLYTLDVWSRGKRLVLFSRDEVEGNRTRGENKTNWFPEGTIHKVFCYIFRLSLKQSYSKNKQTKTVCGQQLCNCIPVGMHFSLIGACGQESTNHSANFVE